MPFQVLAENNQLRKEADDLGPRAELEHWKKRLSKFNYLLDHLKSPDVRGVLVVLAAARSKLLKVVSHFFLLCATGVKILCAFLCRRVTRHRKMVLYLQDQTLRLDNVALL